MKPIDIEVPFEWNDRKIMIHDRIWYLPSHLKNESEFNFPGWENPLLFGNDRPIVVEYCSGNGAWIAKKAQEFPQYNWVAVEKKYLRVRKIWSKIKNMGLPNLIVICGEAMTATSKYFPADSVNDIYINFPDPWPKNKHAKNRLIRSEFLKEMFRILKEKGKVTFVTDDPSYSDLTISTFQQSEGFKSNFLEPFYTHEFPDYGTSYFEDLWRQKGKDIRYHQFIKTS